MTMVQTVLTLLPYSLLAVPLAVAGALAWLVVKQHKAVLGAMHDMWAKLTTKAAFFWMVIVVFMIVSVLESGQFFNILDHSAVFGLLGYAVAFVIDLVAVASMQARLEAIRMRESGGAKLYLFCVLVCAGLSAYANTATSLHGYDTASLSGAPAWMQVLTPWLGCAFPMLILIMSVTADYIVDRTNDTLDAETYRTHEMKRVDILAVRKQIQEKLLEIDEQLAEIIRQRKEAQRAKKGTREREFILMHLLFREHQKPLDMQKILEDVTNQVKAMYEPQLQTVQGQLAQLGQQLQQFQEGQRGEQTTLLGQIQAVYEGQLWTLHDEMEQLRVSVESVKNASKADDVVEQFKAFYEPQLQGFYHEVSEIKEAQKAAVFVDELRSHYEPKLAVLQDEIERLKDAQNVRKERHTDHSINAVLQGQKDVQNERKTDGRVELSEDVLTLIKHYPKIEAWLSTSQRSVTIDEVIEVSGQSKRKIQNRLNEKVLERTKRNPNLLTLSSVIEWLKTLPFPSLQGAITEVESAVIDSEKDEVLEQEKCEFLDSENQQENAVEDDRKGSENGSQFVPETQGELAVAMS